MSEMFDEGDLEKPPTCRPVMIPAEVLRLENACLRDALGKCVELLKEDPQCWSCDFGECETCKRKKRVKDVLKIVENIL